jgi:hypothetical protein
MNISKYKKIIGVTLVLTLATVFTVFNITDNSCYSNKVFSINECTTAKINTPNWWNWITSYKSSEFHFFQLLELIHVNDVNPVK